MKKTIAAIFFLAMTCLMSAQEKATLAEAVQKCKEAAKLVQDKGFEKAYPLLMDKNGPFVWKDSYVWIIDADKYIDITHPVKPEIMNKDFISLKDPKGRPFFVEMVKTALEKGEGWVYYEWPKPDEKTTSPKVTYVYRIGKTNMIAAAGVYDYNLEQAKKELAK